MRPGVLNQNKIAFIVNPFSANGTTGRQWPKLEARARKLLGPFRTCITKGPNDALLLVGRVLASGIRILICVGGDGTLNEVVNGIMGQEERRRSDIILGFIPRGTGADFSRSAPVPTNADRALEAIASCRTCPIDLGRLDYKDHNGRMKSRFFHNVLSFGLGGEVDAHVNRMSNVLGDSVSFIWATLISILRYNTKSIRLTVDDHFDQVVKVWNVVIANGMYHGGGMLVAPGAKIDDGAFQITLIGNLSRPAVFWNLPKLYNGKIYEHKKILKLTGRRVKATSSQEVLLDMDGEQPGVLPVNVEMVPSALRLICER